MAVSLCSLCNWVPLGVWLLKSDPWLVGSCRDMALNVGWRGLIQSGEGPVIREWVVAVSWKGWVISPGNRHFRHAYKQGITMSVLPSWFLDCSDVLYARYKWHGCSSPGTCRIAGTAGKPPGDWIEKWFLQCFSTHSIINETQPVPCGSASERWL